MRRRISETFVAGTSEIIGGAMRRFLIVGWYVLAGISFATFIACLLIADRGKDDSVAHWWSTYRAGRRWGLARGLRQSRAEVRQEAGLCARCGYSLVGNVSGICPECGMRMAENASASTSTATNP